MNDVVFFSEHWAGDGGASILVHLFSVIRSEDCFTQKMFLKSSDEELR